MHGAVEQVKVLGEDSSGLLIVILEDLLDESLDHRVVLVHCFLEDLSMGFI